MVYTKMTVLFSQKPKCFGMGKSIIPVGYGSKRRIKERADCFYYIPILETQTALQNNKQIREEVLKQPQYRSEGKSGDFIDGAVFSNHEVFFSDVQALQIIHYDDCDICNSVGSRVTKHKIASFILPRGI